MFDTIEDADGKKKRVLNAKETTLAAQKQQLIRDAFRDWIWAEPQRRQALVRQYNEEMNSTRPAVFAVCPPGRNAHDPLRLLGIPIW